ncbi:SRPBCC family protein [Janibacter anophelis]|uniref:SRPBCC family protein n=1 Tax=Janibacter anophelis TaxID=319054 RepID=UPI003F7E30B2
MSWTRTASAHLPVTAEEAWRVLSDLTRWPQWEPAIASVRLDAPLAKGATGSYSPSSRWVRGCMTARLLPFASAVSRRAGTSSSPSPAPAAPCGSGGG